MQKFCFCFQDLKFPRILRLDFYTNSPCVSVWVYLWVYLNLLAPLALLTEILAEIIWTLRIFKYQTFSILPPPPETTEHSSLV